MARLLMLGGVNHPHVEHLALAMRERGHEVVVEGDSPEGFLDYFVARFPPLVTAKQNLGDRFEGLRGELLELYKARNRSGNGGLRFPHEYLLSIVRL
jgi:hypothetical protein